MFGIGTTELLLFVVFSTGIVLHVSGVRLPDRFSLRTLLIATTVIAVVLGMAAYFARN